MNEYKKALDGLTAGLRNWCIDTESQKIILKLIDKAKPKKPHHGDWGYRCPTCNTLHVYDYEYDNKFNYCSNCGQKLDWSDVNE